MVDRQGRGGEGSAGGSSSGLADAPTINRNITNKTLVYSSIVCFLAWVFFVYDYTLFGALLPVISDEFGWSTSFGTFILTLVSIGTKQAVLEIAPGVELTVLKQAIVRTVTEADEDRVLSDDDAVDDEPLDQAVLPQDVDYSPGSNHTGSNHTGSTVVSDGTDRTTPSAGADPKRLS